MNSNWGEASIQYYEKENDKWITLVSWHTDERKEMIFARLSNAVKNYVPFSAGNTVIMTGDFSVLRVIKR